MTAAALLNHQAESVDFSAVYEIVPPRLAKLRLPAVILEIISLFDGSRSLGDVVEYAQISTTKTEAVVKKLTHLGVIRPATLPAAAAASVHFSEDEHAFFEAEIQPIDACDLPFETLSDKIRRATTGWVRDIVRR